MLIFAALTVCVGCANPVTDGAAHSSLPAKNASTANVKPAIPASGDILVAGGATGTDASFQSLASAEFFDPSQGKFIVTGWMGSSRAIEAIAPISSSKLIVAGGATGSAGISQFTLGVQGTVLGNSEIFDESTGAFSPGAAMTSMRAGYTATTLKNGKVLIAGGIDAAVNILDTAEIYDPANGKFSPVANTMTDHRVLHTATLLLNGKVLIAGGVTNLSGVASNSADLYDPTTNSFTQAIHAMDHERAGHTATLLTGGPLAGNVLIAGGGGGSGFFLKDSTAEIFDTNSQQFVLLDSFLNEARSLHTATLLDNGTVLIAGGFNGSVAVTGGMLSGAVGSISNSAEIFDPSTLTFSCVGGFNSATMRCAPGLSDARAAHTATLMTSGPLQHQVLIAGGIGGSDPDAPGHPLASADLFNPAGGGSFTKTGSMSAPRALHSAALLP
ncbi:MAG TPA: kelch repeat-containing protein [Candidatus Binataceae bacterium]|nr:kelch repeat-containing protein [Candidatus Binataceae bacterium]